MGYNIWILSSCFSGKEITIKNLNNEGQIPFSEEEGLEAVKIIFATAVQSFSSGLRGATKVK
jgi:hypothetical protein